MPLLEMEHFLVLTADIEASKDFYQKALRFSVGFRPELAFPGYWLYLNETPVIHIAEREAYARYLDKLGVPRDMNGSGTGALDHIAFNCSDFDEQVDRLQQLGIEFARDTLKDIGLRQLFVLDPNGIKIELNYRRGA
jgi:catechol 2,3-dioxygenase-like lactoylglutathione lyase family enzyme